MIKKAISYGRAKVYDITRNSNYYLTWSNLIVPFLLKQSDPLGNVMEKISNAGTVYKESKYYYWEATAGWSICLMYIYCICSVFSLICDLNRAVGFNQSEQRCL